MCANRSAQCAVWRTRAITAAIATLVVIILASFLLCVQYRRQMRLIRKIESYGGGQVFTEQRAPDLLRELLGDELLRGLEPITMVACGFEPEASSRDDLLLEVGQIASLEGLSLQTPDVTDIGVYRCRQLKRLKMLELSGTKISSVSLQHIGHLGQLEVLDLTGTAVTDAGLRHLGQLPQLKRLFLGDTHISDEGIQSLKTLRTLEILDVWGTAVTKQGAERLRRHIPSLEIRHFSDG